MDKHGVLIVARTASSRLPGKALLRVKGKTLFEHQLARVRQAESVGSVVLCTTTLPSDDALCALAAHLECEVYRGHPTNVPLRLRKAMDAFLLDFAVVVEGDEQFIEPVYISRISQAQQTYGQLVRVCNLPLGAQLFGVHRQGLAWLLETYDTDNMDGWRALWPNRMWGDIDAALPERGTARLTVDWPEDFALLVALYERLYNPERIFALAEVLELLAREPELSEINANRR
jgi:spore coat polysaccharide biosynthesis protein SpsF